MGEKIIVGPINKGLRNDRTAFVIDNDSFPVLINAYQWRGRVKRKRGTSLLGRLTRNLVNVSTSPVFAPGGPGIFSYNLFAGLGLLASNPNASFIPGNIFPITLNFVGFGQTLTDPNGNGILQVNGAGIISSATINYATGIISVTVTGAGIATIFVTASYYPSLPVMGLEELALTSTQFPGTLAFDTRYSYNILTAFPYTIYDVSFYKNPAADAVNLPGYIPKTTWTPTTWNGQDYQQFWTVNYQGALWATNGINVPFNPTNIGMQYNIINNVTINGPGTPPASANITFVNPHGLVVGDFLFINEVNGIVGINFQSGYVTVVVNANTVTVVFPFATLTGAYTSGGIAQYLTNRFDPTVDSLRWYDGDPTNGTGIGQTFVEGNGWVNFAPPLSQLPFSIGDAPPRQYYLVGARMIVPFKDRLLFLGPVIQSSAAGSQIYLQDTIIYSQNGTPYYTASFSNPVTVPPSDNPTSPLITFHPILVPINQTATAPAYFEDQTGFGGFISAGISQPILTCSSNEDVLIVGFDNTQTRLIYSGNDIVPFNFFLINSELGSGSTFSIINMDKGALTRGQRGYIITSQTETRRIDLDIPDQVFQIGLLNNGNERVTAQRDYINEWAYFTYPDGANEDKYKFPNETLQYNYRDDSWAIFNETYTHYGSFRKSSGLTWGTIGAVYPNWASWTVPWNAGSSNLEQPEVIAGNQQGFVLFRDDGTNEGNSLYIQNFSSSLVTSPDHTLNDEDYIIISDVLGTIGTQVNGKIFSIKNTTTNTFILNPSISAGTYLGGGVIKRLYRPFIQTKQFPVSWGIARKTRIGVQQYLLSTTANAQIQLLIFLSQNDSNPYNEGPIIPDINTDNNSLIYNTVLFTCPESTNMGLTPANTNLNMVTAINQAQIWHRINTSLIGDTVQLGFTLSDAQMRSLVVIGPLLSITGASKTNPAVLTVTNTFIVDQVVEIVDVLGMTQLNDNRYMVISATPTTVTIGVDATNFDTYISGGTIKAIAPNNQFAEIELHSFIIDVTPSMVLA